MKRDNLDLKILEVVDLACFFSPVGLCFLVALEKLSLNGFLILFAVLVGSGLIVNDQKHKLKKKRGLKK